MAMRKFTITAGCAIAAAAISMPAAHADEQGYLDELASQGVHPFFTMTAGNLVNGGMQMCNLMRSGMSPQDAANSLGILSGVLGVPAASAAQHQLCPDTMR